MRKKMLLSGLLACMLLITAAPTGFEKAGAESEIAVSLNGNPMSFSVQPYLVQNTLMVPLREISEALGAEVNWNFAEKTAVVTKAGHAVKLQADQKDAVRDGIAIKLDEAPVMEKDSLLVPLRFFSTSFDFNVYWDAANQQVSIVDADKSLPTVGSLERMLDLLKESAAENGDRNMLLPMSGAAADVKMKSDQTSATVPATASNESAKQAAGPAYSTTNVQVEGVDEADIVKTDGKYIYQVNQNRVIVAEAYPAENMRVVSTLNWADTNFHPREIYVDEKHLVVIGNTVYTENNNSSEDGGYTTQSPGATPPAASAHSKIAVLKKTGRTATKALVYELADRSNLKQVRAAELEGQYVSSRKMGDSLYLITEKRINYYPQMNRELNETEKQSLAAPSYRDSAAGDTFIPIGYEDIRYFPNGLKPNYLLLAGFNLNLPEQKMQATGYLGSADQVYASQEHLFINVKEYKPAKAEPASSGAATPNDGAIMPAPKEAQSVIYKFGMNNGTIHYVGRGKVPGHPLNQFAMDEQDGYFRIATTKGEAWRTDEYTSKNNLYVLDESMNIVGQIEDIAPGERIYSVRYSGNRAYMVTFKKVDPLFVIDLSQPQAPKIMGKLKIPGYSDYLHPYDENYIIGFGKEAVEVPNKNGVDGQDTAAFYQGLKLALFDVTDVEHPIEMFKETIGDRGTDSELLHNHKALLFSKDKNILAFPVTVMEVKDKSATPGPENAMNNGEFTFQGAYVYKLDLQNGFQLKGKITHLSGDDLQKAGSRWYESERNIHRLLFIENRLYSTSLSMIKANDISSLHEVGSLPLPPWNPKP